MIRPDRWIRRKSMPPTHSIAARVGSSDIASLAWEGITHTKDQLADLCNRFWAAPLKDTHTLIRDFKPMIEPFEPGQVRGTPEDRKISYGTSSYGYDVRCADEFKIFTNINSAMIDPKNFDPKTFVDHKGEFCIIPPNSFVLARTVEYFRIPRNVLVTVLGKSTYARSGILCTPTPLEPEWEGNLVLEFSNTTTLPAKLYANEGCAQLLFFESDEECETSYKDRGGKYQGQTSVTLPRM